MTTIGSAGSASLFNPALNAQPVTRPVKPVFGHISAIRQNHGQMSTGRVNTDSTGTSAQPLDALKERALNTPVSTHFDKFFHHSLKAEINEKLPTFSGVKGLSGRNKKLAETLLALLQQLKTESPDKFDKGDSRSLDALFKQADSYKGNEKDFVRKFWKEAAPLITKLGSSVFDRLHNEVTELSEQAWLKKAGGSEIGERQVFDAHYRRSTELTAGELDRAEQHILPEIFRDNFENAWRKIISIPHTLVPCKISPPPAGETPEQPNQVADEPDASAEPDVQFQPDEKNSAPDKTQPMVINYNDNRITIGGDNYHLYADDTKAQGVNESGEHCESGNDNPPVFSGIKDALVKVSNRAGNQTDETDSLPPHADKAAQIDSGYFDYDVPELALNSDLFTETDGLSGPEKAGNQPATVAVPASRTERATETAEPAGAGKKWVTVQPAAPFIGGSGSAS
ncbi:hypothetical protein, partial [Hafnia paralvei]|uniref:hypothetical protein n=1 Tax=Hafnia paralvei TaxID=546367 RepID=UPI00300C99CC